MRVCIGPGWMAVAIANRPNAIAPPIATGRHRGEGSRPSGNSSGMKNMMMHTIGRKIHESSHADAAAPGRAGRAARPTTEYSAAKASTAARAPTRRRSQPISWLRLETMSTPTVPNVTVVSACQPRNPKTSGR